MNRKLRKNNHTFWMRLLFLFGVLVYFFGPVSAQSTDKTSNTKDLLPIRLQLKWKHQFQFAGYYAALERGYYEEAGFDVTILESDGDQDPVDSVVSGNADFGIGTSELILHYAEGKPIKLLACIFQHSPLVFLTTDASGISSIHELSGKKVAFENQAAELAAYLRYEGIPEESINRVKHPYEITPLITGEVDAISAYSTDETFLLKEKEIPFRIFNPRAGGIDFYGDSLFTTSAFAEEEPEVVEAFLAATLKGWEDACSNPDEMVELIYTQYSQRHSREHLSYEAQKTIGLILPDIVELGYVNTGRWRFIADTYVELGLLEDVPDVEEFVFNSSTKFNYTKFYLVTLILLIVLIIASAIILRFYRLNRKLAVEILDRHHAEEELRQAEKRYRELVENAPFPIAVTDEQSGSIRFLNPSARSVLGIGSEDTNFNNIKSFYANPEERKQILEELDKNNKIQNAELRLRRVDGSHLWALLSISRIQYENNSSLFSTFFDITERYEKDLIIKNSHEELRIATDSVTALIARLDRDGNCTFANSTFEHWFSVGRTEMIGKNITHFFTEAGRSEFLKSIREGFEGLTSNLEQQINLPTGSRAVSVQLTPHLQGDQVTALFMVATDITKQKEKEFKLQEMAQLDTLTGLLNRRAMESISKQEFAVAKNGKGNLSFAMIDIDHFKSVNDKHGHAVGDEVLKQVANLLAGNIRERDFLVRFGGEEFLLIMPGTHHQAALESAVRLKKLLESFTLVVDELHLKLTISIGVSSISESDQSFNDTIKRADELLYQAKQQGRNCVVGEN